MKLLTENQFLSAQEFIPLDQESFTTQLKNLGFARPYQLYIFSTIDSTNRYLKDLPSSTRLDICCAEAQTQGRGRFGRHWHSPFGENIYCSSRWQMHTDLAKLSGLSLVSSLAVLKTLGQFINTAEIRLKWPNDILWQDKKLCGILIETLPAANDNIQLIIGIGLNVNADPRDQSLVNQGWSFLFELSKQRFNRNLILASLINNLHSYFYQFLQQGLTAFLNEWAEHDYLRGKLINVKNGTREITGIAVGIEASGLLMLNDEQGNIHYLSSGDSSVACFKNS